MVPSTESPRRHHQRKIRCCSVVAATAVAHAFAACIVASCSRGCHASTTAAVVGWSASFTAASSSAVHTANRRYHPSALCFTGGGGSLVRCRSSTSFTGGAERRLTLQGESCSSSSSSSSKAVVMGPASGKRGTTGRPASRNGVGKKVRRILEPASPAEVAYEEKKDKVSMMNWGNLGKSGRGNGKRGGGGRGGAAGAMGTGLDAAWKEASLPKEGDMLKCKHFNVCPGCEFDRRFDETPIMIDSSSYMDNLHAAGVRARGLSAAPLEFEHHVIHGWDPHGWRTVAKLATRPVSKWGGVELGLYKLASHDVLGIPECRVHHPSVNLAVAAVQASAKKIGVTGFRQENLDGDLRYVQIAVERTSGQVQLTLVWNEECYRDATPKLQLFAKDLRSSKPELFHSIWANFRVGPGNAIFSRDPTSWHRCSGPEYLKEVVGPNKVPFFFSPPLFRQGNLDHFERIVEAVVDWVPEGSGVCELYAGVGVLGLNCAYKASFVRCSDVNSFNPRSFARSKRSLPPALQKQVSFEPLSAEDAIEDGEAEDCEVLIVDPPRKGLDKGVVDSLTDPDDPNTSALRRVVYVSCGFDALKRDSMSLISSGWTLRHSEGFVLFPGSDHIETLAIFDR